MAFLLGLLKGQQQPPTVPTDTVIPLHYLDDTGFFAGVVLDIGMIYDEVLDPEKLRRAMESLLERPGWKKLGARIRKNVRLPVVFPNSGWVSQNHVKDTNNLPRKLANMNTTSLWRTQKNDPA